MTYTIYMGWDSREQLAYDVAQHSIFNRTKDNVYVVPLKLEELSAYLENRPIERKENGKLWCPISQAPMATEFAISRFVVPFLKDSGWALFVDCDIVCLTDIIELFNLADTRYAVMVVKHNQASGPTTKMDGQVQIYYSRKNWSSVVLWNCSHPAHRNLTLEALRTWPGRDLHAFKWLNDEEIGELPRTWNYLVGVSEIGPDNIHPKIAHYTEGGPWLPNWESRPTDNIWLEERKTLDG